MMDSLPHRPVACVVEHGIPWWMMGAALAALIVAALPADVAAQGCAMCKTAIGGPEDPLARGLNVSILFLLSMPFLLVASVGMWFAYMYRRRRLMWPRLRVFRALPPAARTAKEGSS